MQTPRSSLWLLPDRQSAVGRRKGPLRQVPFDLEAQEVLDPLIQLYVLCTQTGQRMSKHPSCLCLAYSPAGGPSAQAPSRDNTSHKDLP